jgi:Protein of unknown function (DUF3485)
MSKVLIVLAAVLMLAAGGAVEIARSGRTASDKQVNEAKAKLAAIPLTVGDWVGKDVEFDTRQLEQAEAAAHVNRVYVREKTGDAITLLILAGSPKAIGAHDPTVCYGGAGFKQFKPEQSMPVEAGDGKRDTFWSARFDTDTFPITSLQVQWAWTVDGNWAASTRPRIDYARDPLLYKVYVSRQIGQKATDDKDPTMDLLTVLMPDVRRSLASLPAK